MCNDIIHQMFYASQIFPDLDDTAVEKFEKKEIADLDPEKYLTQQSLTDYHKSYIEKHPYVLECRYCDRFFTQGVSLGKHVRGNNKSANIFKSVCEKRRTEDK